MHRGSGRVTRVRGRFHSLAENLLYRFPARYYIALATTTAVVHRYTSAHKKKIASGRYHPRQSYGSNDYMLRPSSFLLYVFEKPMISGTSTIVGKSHTNRLTASMCSNRGAPNTVKAVTVAMQHDNMPTMCSTAQCDFVLGVVTQYNICVPPKNIPINGKYFSN